MRKTTTTVALVSIILLAPQGALAAKPSLSSAEELLSKEQAATLIESYQTNRATSATAHPVPASSLAANRYAPGLLKRLATEKKQIESNRKEISASTTYDASKIEVEITSFTPSQGTVEVGTREIVKLHFKGEGTDELSYSAQALNKSYRFGRDASGTWVLSDVNEDTDSALRANGRGDGSGSSKIQGHLVDSRPFPAAPQGARDYASLVKKDAPETMQALAATPYFDRAAGVSYAVKYALNYNPAYKAWANDCTNFVSQIMAAGGWSQHGNSTMTPISDYRVWFYLKYVGAVRQTSVSWINAQRFHEYARSGSQRTVGYQGVQNTKVGDIYQFIFSSSGTVMDHSAFVTKRSPSEIYLTYHTLDMLNEPLTAILKRNPGMQIFFDSPK